MTLEMAVAPIALALANHPHLEDHDLSSLRYIMWGATPVTESVADVVTERTGVRWLPAYGASEVPVIAANPVERPEAWRLDSAGLPPAGRRAPDRRPRQRGRSSRPGRSARSRSGARR
jgi:long-chain acyl-CoA synthetase